MDNSTSLFRRLESYVNETSDPIHRYMFSCIVEQRLADLLLLTRCGIVVDHELNARLTAQRRVCVQYASGLIQGGAQAPSAVPAWPVAAVSPASIRRRRAELLPLMKVMQELRTPECSGYDLCDLEVCYEDALNWLREAPADSSPPLLIGVRTGGAYYAPFWSSAFRQRWGNDALYYTVRPLRQPSDPQAPAYLPEEFSLLPDELEPGTEIMILEDQPHTGQTVLELSRSLAAKYRLAKPIWVSSPGRLFRVENDRLLRIKDSVPLAAGKPKRIWQMLGNARELVEALEQRLDWRDMKSDLEIVPYKAIQEWNHPSRRGDVPFRINPRKTPFIVKRKSNGEPVAFAKFIGKDLFGDFQAHQLQKFAPYFPRVESFVDGYVITGYEPGVTEMRETLARSGASLQRQVLDEVAPYWKLLLENQGIGGDGMVHSLAEGWAGLLEEMERLVGANLPCDRAWFEHGLHTEWSRPTHVYSSLPYANQHWHWKAGRTAGGRITICRFHADSIWGGTSCLEVELASFILENRVKACGVRLLADGVRKYAPFLQTQEIVRALPIACMLKMANLVKEMKGERRWGKERMLSELMESFRHLHDLRAELSEE